MIVTCTHGDVYIQFEYNFKPSAPILFGNMEEVPFRNAINIIDYSYDLDVDISMGKVKLGSAKFDLDFSTYGMTETVAISGQFYLAVSTLLQNHKPIVSITML